MPSGRGFAMLSLLLVLWASPRAAFAQDHGSSPLELPEATRRALQSLVGGVVEVAVPHEYTEDDDWGKTKWVTRELKFDTRGLLPRLRRVKHPVKHGDWSRYRIARPAGDENLSFELSDASFNDKGELRVDAVVATPLKLWGQYARWHENVQLISLSCDADAAARLTLDMTIRAEMRLDTLPPSLGLAAEVTEARLKLTDFRVRRISKADGPIVRELSDSIHRIAQKMIDKKRRQLVEKANKEIAKQTEKLRLTPADAALFWRPEPATQATAPRD